MPQSLVPSPIKYRVVSTIWLSPTMCNWNSYYRQPPTWNEQLLNSLGPYKTPWKHSSIYRQRWLIFLSIKGRRVLFKYSNELGIPCNQTGKNTFYSFRDVKDMLRTTYSSVNILKLAKLRRHWRLREMYWGWQRTYHRRCLYWRQSTKRLRAISGNTSRNFLPSFIKKGLQVRSSCFLLFDICITPLLTRHGRRETYCRRQLTIRSNCQCIHPPRRCQST